MNSTHALCIVPSKVCPSWIWPSSWLPHPAYGAQIQHPTAQPYKTFVELPPRPAKTSANVDMRGNPALARCCWVSEINPTPPHRRAAGAAGQSGAAPRPAETSANVAGKFPAHLGRGAWAQFLHPVRYYESFVEPLALLCWLSLNCHSPHAGGHFSFCWYFCWYFFEKWPVFIGGLDSLTPLGRFTLAQAHLCHQATRQILSILVPPGAPIGSPQVMA